MLPLPVYYALLIPCLIYAFAKGGSPERIGAALLTVGSVVSLLPVIGNPDRFKSVENWLLLIDLVVLAAFAALALRADRFWPIWATALVALGPLGHLARWYAGDAIMPRAYAASVAIWSYAIIALIAIGTLNHHRRIHLTCDGGEAG